MRNINQEPLHYSLNVIFTQMTYNKRQ